jgi:hypothetical protein
MSQLMCRTAEDCRFLGVLIPAGTKLPADPNEVDRLLQKLKPGQKTLMTIAQQLTMIMTGKVRPYPGNRGGKHLVNRDTYDSVVENGLVSDVAGEFSFGMYVNEEYFGDNKEHRTMCCWHSRAKGCLVRYLTEQMTPAELKSVISISFVSNFLSAYQAHGISGQAHTKKMKIRCMDFAYGEHIKRVEDMVGPIIAEKLKGFATPLSTIFYTMHLQRTEPNIAWDWVSVYSRRGPAGEIADNLRGSFEITEDELQNLTQAIIYWNELMAAFNRDIGKIKLRNVTLSSGLFGYFVTTHYATKMKDFSKDINVLSERMANKHKALEGVASELCRANFRQAVQDLEDMLTTKANKKKAS